MKLITRSLLLALLVAPFCAYGQGAHDFQVNKIGKNLITSPQYGFTGAQQYTTNQRERWLEIEIEFTAVPELTDELTFKAFVLLNGNLLTGEVTNVGILAGKNNRTVLYVSPRGIAIASGNASITPASITNIAVQIVQKGSVKDELNLARMPAQWYSTMKAMSGYVLNKNETPFGPLYWDRYEQIKPAVQH